jgi:hypothetical protein
MAIELSVRHHNGQLLVWADNKSANTVIIDYVILTLQAATWTLHRYYYLDYGSGHVYAGFGKVIVGTTEYSSVSANVHATAHYFEVNQTVKSLAISVP